MAEESKPTAEKSAAGGRSMLFMISLPICAVIGVLGIIWPAGLADAVNAFTQTVFRSLDWFFLAVTTGLLLLGGWLAVSKSGRLKLGAPDEEPEFSTASWLAMLFAAGMGVGLLFWGVAEPMLHYIGPPTGVGSDPASARRAMVITNFHWGLHAWAIYGVGALVLAFFSFRRGGGYLPSEPIRLAYSGSWVRPVGKLADLLAVISVAFGVAGSIAMGVMQFHTGLSIVTDVPAQSVAVQMTILGVLFVAYMTSAATSLDKGIRILSSLNMALAIGLLLFVLFTGPTSDLLRGCVSALGDYISALPELSLNSYPYAEKSGWLHGWTIVYFIWWIAWTPFVGIFIARISRGRTIREFVLGVIIAPTLFSIVWFSIFGGTGLQAEMAGADLSRVVTEDVTGALYSLFETLPLSSVLAALSLVLVFVFLVTSVDSATYVLGMLTSKGSMDPPTSRKLGWGVSLAVLGGALTLSGNIDVIRAMAISGAVPFVFILLLQVGALLRGLREEANR